VTRHVVAAKRTVSFGGNKVALSVSQPHEAMALILDAEQWLVLVLFVLRVFYKVPAALGPSWLKHENGRRCARPFSVPVPLTRTLSVHLYKLLSPHVILVCESVSGLVLNGK